MQLAAQLPRNTNCDGCRQPNIHCNAQFVVNSFSYSCDSSSSSASVFQHNSVSSHRMISLSVSSSQLQSVNSSASHINLTIPAVQPFSQFLCHLLLVQSFWKLRNHEPTTRKLSQQQNCNNFEKFFHALAELYKLQFSKFFTLILQPIT